MPFVVEELMRLEQLQLRDLEVLRSLVRLEYVTTRQFTGALFPSMDVARRRLRRLHDLSLVQPHTRGISEHLGYQAWRLTAAGIEAVARAFRDEPLRDGLLERLKAGSLANIDHREELVDLYFRVLAGDDGEAPQEANRSAVAARAARLRARAAALRWDPDGAVVLRYRTVAGEEHVKPDATVTSLHRPVRVFVELDRSTHNGARLRDSFQRYARYVRQHYAAAWPDGRRPVLLVVTRSAERATNVAAIARGALGETLPVHVALAGDAARWLDGQVIDRAQLAKDRAAAGAAVAPACAAGAPLRTAARDVYRWFQTYREGLRARGGDLPADGLQALRQLYEALAKETSHAQG
jgi:hypothetical protein